MSSRNPIISPAVVSGNQNSRQNVLSEQGWEAAAYDAYERIYLAGAYHLLSDFADHYIEREIPGGDGQVIALAAWFPVKTGAGQ